MYEIIKEKYSFGGNERTSMRVQREEGWKEGGAKERETMTTRTHGGKAKVSKNILRRIK